MRLGIDIANFSMSKAVERIILISGDTDCVPAMKYGRIAGLQIVIIQLPKQQLARELLYHADESRSVKWPANAQKFKEWNYFTHKPSRLLNHYPIFHGQTGI